MSERAQKILAWLLEQETKELPIRQQALAEHFNCSRRTIGRCLKELKEAGLLTDLNKRHENRCKMYFVFPSPVSGEVLTPEAKNQWDLYSGTFKCIFKTLDEQTLKNCYAKVTWQLDGIKDTHELWRKSFDGMYALPECEAVYAGDS